MLAEWPHQSLLLVLFTKPKKKIPKTHPDPLDFPCAIMLISYIMWSMYFVGETIRRGQGTCSD